MSDFRKGELPLPRAWERYHRARWKGNSPLDKPAPRRKMSKAEIRRNEKRRIEEESELEQAVSCDELTVYIRIGSEIYRVEPAEWNEALSNGARPFSNDPFATFRGKHGFVEEAALMSWLGAAAKNWNEEPAEAKISGAIVSVSANLPAVKQKQQRRLNNRWGWTKIDEKIVALIDKNGMPGETDDPSWTQAKIAAEIQTWCILNNKLGEAPAVSQINDHVSRCLKQLKSRSA